MRQRVATARSPHASLRSIKNSQLGAHLRSIREAISVIHVSRGTAPIDRDRSCGSTAAISAGAKTRRQGRLQANAPNTSRNGLRCATGRTVAVNASTASKPTLSSGLWAAQLVTPWTTMRVLGVAFRRRHHDPIHPVDSGSTGGLTGFTMASMAQTQLPTRLRQPVTRVSRPRHGELLSRSISISAPA